MAARLNSVPPRKGGGSDSERFYVSSEDCDRGLRVRYHSQSIKLRNQLITSTINERRNRPCGSPSPFSSPFLSSLQSARLPLRPTRRRSRPPACLTSTPPTPRTPRF